MYLQERKTCSQFYESEYETPYEAIHGHDKDSVFFYIYHYTG